MEQNVKRMHMYVTESPLLYSKNKHNILNQLYLNLEKGNGKVDLF